jgi:hypothetical protein
MARIVMDALSHQAIRHLGTETAYYGVPAAQAGRWQGVRLSGMLSVLDRMGHGLEFAHPSEAELDGAAVLLIASRSEAQPFDGAGIAAVAALVRRGGGLWLMANHRRFVKPQQQIAAALEIDVELNDVSISNYPAVVLLPHPISDGCGRVHIRNASTLTVGPRARMVGYFATDPRHGFAAAARSGGRVLVTSDSGFIASRDDAGETMFETGGNARFFENAIGWLTSGASGLD